MHLLSGARDTLRRVFRKGTPRHRHVFICGLHRSGTSVLHDILKAHPRITGFSSTGKPKDEGQHVQSIIGRDADFGGPGVFCFHPGAHLTESDVATYREQLPHMIASWEHHWAPDTPVRVEKSPPNLVRSRFLQSIFDDARFVFIVRHPLAVARATQKWSLLPEERLFRHWFQGHRIMLADRAFIRRSCCVRYEDLAADLSGTLARIWRAIGIPGTTIDASAFADHNPRYLEAPAGYDVNADERALMARFGYDLASPHTRFDRRYGW